MLAASGCAKDEVAGGRARAADRFDDDVDFGVVEDSERVRCYRRSGLDLKVAALRDVTAQELS